MNALATSTAAAKVREQVRDRARVRGGVQGVGFRPFVHALAQQCELTGHVGNDADGVFLEVEGDADAVERFFDALQRHAPPQARIETVERASIPPRGTTGFGIVASTVSAAGGQRRAVVSQDIGTCDACLAELRDPTDRRYRYPFINCSHCGPRYTIVRDLPYDRAKTTMAAFTMCVSCQREYDTPTHRRFHAQPNACPDCGPQLSWERSPSASAEMLAGCDGSGDPLGAALRCIRAGGTVAVKGVGGFHLVCDATNPLAVQRLRDRKQRAAKPLAVMVATIDVALGVGVVSDAEAALLCSAEAPIVLLRARVDNLLAPNIAPGHDLLGVMLPYAPLHHLLAADGPLVMTSGNVSDEPIAYTNDEARARLAPLCDGLLLHDREIAMPCDDSVMRVVRGDLLPIRRSRGYAPYPVALPAVPGSIGAVTSAPYPSVLAVGGELKATLCITRDQHAFLSPHIGDVAGIETRALLTSTMSHLSTLLETTPMAVACDAHPDYASAAVARAWAAERGLPVMTVQHHHAHVASLMAEHGLTHERVIGVAFDGTGYGTDGTIWGGEVLVADYHGFERVAHLAPTQLPGGDSAVRHPARVALAQLHAAGVAWEDAPDGVQRAINAESRRVLTQQLDRGFGCVTTSSMGRLLDAASALCGGPATVSYEGQAAVEFEAMAWSAMRHDPSRDRTGGYVFAIAAAEGRPMTFDAAPVLRRIIGDLRRGVDRGLIAMRMHSAIADAIVRVAVRVRDRHQLDLVGLTGGVFQNVLLLTLARERLHAAGFRVLTHRRVPPNDGGIALGQAMIAATMIAATKISTTMLSTRHDAVATSGRNDFHALRFRPQ